MAKAAKPEPAPSRTCTRPSAAKRKSSPKQLPEIPRPRGKLGLIIDCVSQVNGATADELAAETCWQRHSVLGALSRLRARGFAIHRAADGERRTYRLDVSAGAR